MELQKYMNAKGRLMGKEPGAACIERLEESIQKRSRMIEKGKIANVDVGRTRQDEGRKIGMIRCYDCAKLEAYFIDSWDVFVYRCNKFRTLRMRIDTNIGKCPYFEAKKKQ